MIFHSVIMTETGKLTAKAVGHPTEVIKEFHTLASLLLSSRGPWRITQVEGVCDEDTPHDSNMGWQLEADLKKTATVRTVL